MHTQAPDGLLARRKPAQDRQHDDSGLRFEALLTPSQGGAYLGVHEKTAIRMAREGELPALRIGKHWRFRRSDLEAWAATRVESRRQPVE
jgi:excisionase family DNA binding protein